MDDRANRHTSVSEVNTRLTRAELSELERRSAHLGISRSELIRRYIRSGLSVRASYGTVVDIATGEHVTSATEPHISIWLRSFHSASAPGIFAIDASYQPVSLPMAKRTDRRVTVLNPPTGFDVTRPDSPDNLRILREMRQASEEDLARWMWRPLEA
jgi:hypothetical protein